MRFSSSSYLHNLFNLNSICSIESLNAFAIFIAISAELKSGLLEDSGQFSEKLFLDYTKPILYNLNLISCDS